MNQQFALIVFVCALMGCACNNSHLKDDRPSTADNVAPTHIHTDVLALSADRPSLKAPDGRAKAKMNWFRTYDAEKGIWIQSDLAGGPEPHTRAVTSAAEGFLRKTGRADLKLIATYHHAYLWVLVYEWPAPPAGMSRMDGGPVTIWYDAYANRVVAVTD